MPKGLVTPAEQIDSASIHSLISALVRRGGPSWTGWERLAPAEVTLSLLFRSNVRIPPLPKGPGSRHGTALVDHILEVLDEFVADAHVASKRKQDAIQSAKSWVQSAPQTLQQAYGRFKEDPSSDVFTRWAVARDWLYHVGRLGSLIDDPTFDEVAEVLQWSPQEKRSIRRQSKEPRLVRLWSEKCREHGELPPQEIVDGYLVSSLLRGRYYRDLALLCGGNYVWHSFRNYVIEPVAELSRFDLFADRLTEVYLAGIVCSSAMEWDSDEEVVRSWAENVRRLRSRTVLFRGKQTENEPRVLRSGLRKGAS